MKPAHFYVGVAVLVSAVSVAFLVGRSPSRAGDPNRQDGRAAAGDAEPAVRVVSPAQVDAARRQATGAPLLVDVRETAELSDELGHVEGVTHIPLATLGRAAGSLPRDVPIVVVCRSGARSARGAEELVELGFRDVATMAGGMAGWNAAGLPVKRALDDVRVVR